MSSFAVHPETWTARRWWLIIGAVLVAQVGLLLLLSQRRVNTGPAPVETTVVRIVGDVAQDMSGPSEPALFALLNQHGFSARAWTNYTLLQHSLNDWHEPPQFLPPSAARFGSEFARLAAANAARGLLIDDKPTPHAEAPAVRALEAPTGSALLVGNDLANRPLVQPPALPVWTHTDVLASTIVQVTVNAAGRVLTARQVSGSGFKPADERAMALTRDLCFAPSPDQAGSNRSPWSDLTTGNLTFRWQTRPPNSPTAP